MTTPEERREFIIALAKSFPCLEQFVEHTTPEDWDIDRFMGHYCTMSTGERLCARFVATVWNPSHAHAQGWTFDLIEFVQRADSTNRVALKDWLNNPKFP